MLGEMTPLEQTFNLKNGLKIPVNLDQQAPPTSTI
jgi:hypothetical protein